MDSSVTKIGVVLVSAQRVDGLVVWSGALGSFISPDEMRDFCLRYELPVVNIGHNDRLGWTHTASEAPMVGTAAMPNVSVW